MERWEWPLFNYAFVKSWGLVLYLNPIDVLIIIQAFDVKAYVDQTYREVRLVFFFYAQNFIKTQTSHLQIS